MAFIYKITNLINGKMYVGKTTKTIQQRFKEHCQDSKKERLSHRPLYSDMKEYGCENFSIELLEEDNSNPEQKEIYWIEKLNTKIPNGYNIALGGNGKKLITNQEKEEIVKLYKELSGGNTHGHISACAKGKRKKAYGYYWKYIDN